MATQTDYYGLLGVSRSATDEQIRSAYRKLARQYHPDVNSASDASERFKAITEAYEVLTDPQRRQRYDMFGSTTGGLGDFGIGDLFETFFGGDLRRREPRSDARGGPADGDRDRPPRRRPGPRARHHGPAPRDVRALPRERCGAGHVDLDVRDLQRPRRGPAGPAIGVRAIRECLDVPALRWRRQDRRQAVHPLPGRGPRAQGPRDRPIDPRRYRRRPAAARRG